jgi:ATP-dependent Lon protease
VKLVEQELWQREEKGMIGILPVRDASAASSETPTVTDSVDQNSKVHHGGSSDSNTKVQNDVVHWHNRYSSSEQLFCYFDNLKSNYLIVCMYIILRVH